MVVFAPFSNAHWLLRVRYWLIRRLAGKASIMLNVAVDLTEPMPNILFDVDNCPHGMYISNISIGYMGSKMPRFRSWYHIHGRTTT